MKGPIYDYRKQKWVEIDTSRDRKTGEYSYVTPCGVEYELNPANPSQYRNAVPVRMK